MTAAMPLRRYRIDGLDRFRRALLRRVGLLMAAVILTATPATLSKGDHVLEVDSRGQKIRALLLKPENPVGSVILLAGGHGRLDLGADGRIGWGAGNQLVRTRAAYARAGYLTLVPDIAPDLKTATGVLDRYRYGAPHGRDIGALVQHLRGLKPPVALVATSRGAVSAGAALAHTSGLSRPDAVVLTAAMLVSIGENAPHFRMAIGDDPRRARLPLLVVGHRKDTCRFTHPSTIERFKAWHGGKVDVVMLDGPAGTGDPCEAASAHGFIGIDDAVVTTVTRWIAMQNLPAR
ncbi:MAG: hypothetical protein ABWY92_15595 [Xanthobacteraceae bacterium]|jgi:hypothetical protein